AYLNGLQDHFTLVGGQESARSTLHLAELFRLADAAGLLADPQRAAARMRAVLAARGVAAGWVRGIGVPRKRGPIWLEVSDHGSPLAWGRQLVNLGRCNA